MADLASVIVKLQAALVEAQAASQPKPDPQPDPKPDPKPDPVPVGDIPAITRIPLNLANMVGLVDQLQADRYARYELATVITSASINLPFNKVDIDSGGVRKKLTYSDYRLLVNGVERARATINAANDGGTFVGSLGDEKDEPVMLEIVACDAGGKRVTAPSESLLPFWVTINRNGDAPNADFVVVQSNSFEWSHVDPAYCYAKVPKSAFGATPRPLTPVEAVPFSTALPRTSIMRENLIPALASNDLQTHYPVVMESGVVTTANTQGYNESLMWRLPPQYPSVDGPRGIAVAAFPTFLKAGRNGKWYGCDPHSFFVIDATGARRTLAGLRWPEGKKPYPGDKNTLKNVEVIGNWDAAIPTSERFPRASWGMAWDERTLNIDENAPIPPNETEVPHAGSGPVCLVTDGHGYVLRMQFGATSHAVPATITRVAALKDPWGIARDPVRNVWYVAERQKHRIVILDGDTYAYKGDLIANANGDQLCQFDPPDQITNNARWRPGVTFAQTRAQNIIAPELIELQDDYLYFSSFVQNEVRRINLTTGVVESCCRTELNSSNSWFLYFALGDGTFGPRGTIFALNFSNGYFGRPWAFLPGSGVDSSDGATLTHATRWGYYSYQNGGTMRGVGYSDGDTYPTSCAVGNGMLAFGGSSGGIGIFRQKQAGDSTPDEARATRGCLYWRKRGYNLLFSGTGHGPFNFALPWGENADCDYWLTANGHIRPQ